MARHALRVREGSDLKIQGVGLGAFLVGLLVVSVSVTSAAAAASISFTTPLVIGFTKGDDWEPDVAADGRGNV